MDEQKNSTESSPTYSSGRWQIWAALALGLLLAGAFWFEAAHKKAIAPSTPSATVAANQAHGYDGKLLAGTSAPYYEFTPNGYATAQKDGKTIFLKFYAEWSGISTQIDEPVLKTGFDGLASTKVVGFRVHFADGKNDEAQKKMATDWGVTLEGTKLLIKNGKVTSKSTESWNADQFASFVTKAAQ